MKKNIILILSSIVLGAMFTFFVLNKENIYAKEEYIVYVFQSGAYQTYDKAYENINNMSAIIKEENSLYKIVIIIRTRSGLDVYFINKNIYK